MQPNFEFQSTRPRGARRERHGGLWIGGCFNPRAREGRDIGFSLLPYLAVVNIIYRGYVNNRFNAEKDPVNTDLPNMVQTRIPLERIIGLPKSALHGKPTALILLPNPEVSPAMEIAYYNGKTAPDLIWEGSQLPQHGQAFMQDLYLLKISMRARITMKRPRFCFCLYPS